MKYLINLSSNIIVTLLTVTVLFMVACQPDQPQSQDGKYVKEIDRDVVHLEDGNTIDLDNQDVSKVIYLIRHAEKDTTTASDNPFLTEKGHERGNRLAAIFKKSRVDKIYSTLYNRTLHTVDSLRSSKGVPVSIYQPKDLKELSQNLLSDTEFKVAVVVGHSNTTPGLANTLLKRKEFDKGFDESDYDNFIVVTMKSDSTTAIHKLRYK